MPIRNRTGTVLITIIATLAGLALIVVIALVSGLIPANADAQPGAIERWAAKTSLHATLERGVSGLHNPLTPNDSVLTEGVKLYGANCAVCHGASDAKRSSVAEGLYQRPPQFAKHDVTDDPVEETYWKILHGIRLTGMPSYSKSLTEHQRWAIALFLRYQDSLPPQASAAWKALPSAATVGAALIPPASTDKP